MALPFSPYAHLIELLVTAPVVLAVRREPKYPCLGIPYNRPADLTSALAEAYTAFDNNCTLQIRPVSRRSNKPEAQGKTKDSGRKKPKWVQSPSPAHPT